MTCAQPWIPALASLLLATGGGSALAQTEPQNLALASLGSVAGASSVAWGGTPERAIDGNTSGNWGSDSIYHSDDLGVPNWWQVDLGSIQEFNHIEIWNRTDCCGGRVSNFRLSVRDTELGPDVWFIDLHTGGTQVDVVERVPLPPGTAGRFVRYEQLGVNNEGNYLVNIAEVRVIQGIEETVPLGLSGVASQSSAIDGASPQIIAESAARAVDGTAATYCHTDDLPDSYWQLTLDAPSPIGRVEVVNRPDSGAQRMEGLVLRIFDDQSNSVASTVLSDPGLGGTWSYEPPPGTTGQVIRIGLENGAANGAGDYQVTLGEVRAFPFPNLALGKDAYMVELEFSMSPPAYGNDDDFTTEAKSTARTVDAYWEVDLGQTYALYGIRVAPAAGFGDRTTHATVRLFDHHHESVFSHHLQDSEKPDFYVPWNNVYCARYVRVGYENKERSSPPSIEWYLGLQEVQVYGRPDSEVGILSFTGSTGSIQPGESLTLDWQVDGVSAVTLYPGIGPVEVFTDEAGVGSISVAPTQTVSYLLIARNGSTTYEQAVTVVVGGQPAPVRINEFGADNQLTLRDGYNDSSDWIELYNPGGQAVDLTGYGLSDDAADPLKWVFPALSLPPHEYLLVVASGRSSPWDADGWLHADFRLDAAGGDLVLTTPDGQTTLDAVTGYPPQGEDLAYGPDPDGAITFLEPTPGRANLAATYLGWLDPLHFSVPRGFHDTPFDLSITHTNPLGTILYSLDGTEPSIPYPGPLEISGTTTVRAKLEQAGYRAPRLQTHSYLFLDDIITSPVMDAGVTQDPQFATRLRTGLRDLPTLSIAIPSLPDDYVEQECSVEIFWPDPAEPSIQSNCGMHRFGGAWTDFAKKNYRLKFRDIYGARKLEAPLFDGFDHGVLARDIFDELDLRGGGHDMLQRGFYMSARFQEDAMLDMGSLNPHGRFVHLYLNGTYWGQYHLRERLVKRFLADYLGGGEEAYLNVRGNDNAGDGFVPGNPEPVHRASWERVQALAGSYQAVKPYLDVPHLIDFTLLWAFGNAESEYRAAGPIDAGSGFKFWLGDADGFLRDTGDRTGTPGPGHLLGALRTEGDPDFKVLLADRIYRHFFHQGALTPARNQARLALRMTEIQDSLIAECARWRERTPANWVQAAAAMDQNFTSRTDEMIGYLRNRGMYPSFDPPQYSRQGGDITNGFELALSATTGTIYYTLDGSDPRLPGGGIAPGALAYAYTVSTQALVAAGSEWRFWDAGTPPAGSWTLAEYDDAAWGSGPAQLGYGDGDEATPVSYGSNANDKHITTWFRRTFVLADPSDIDQLQVALVRDDGAVVYLNGVELLRDNLPDGAITDSTLGLSAVGGASESQWFPHTVPADALVAGTNLLAVEIHQVQPTSSDISFDLSLAALQSGQTSPIVLQGNTVVSSRVWTGSEWSALNQARFQLAERRPPEPGDLLFTEIHYNPDGLDEFEFLEIWNASTNLVDFDGVALSDAVGFLFPSGLDLEPGGFLLVVEDEAAFAARYQDPASPWYHPGLRVAGAWTGGLANDGERVALVASNGVTVTEVAYRDSLDWPGGADGEDRSLELVDPNAVPTNVTEGLAYLARGGNWHASSLRHGSPGRFDPYDRPVVINEVLTHTDLDTDWIEVYNRGPVAVDLSGRTLTDHAEEPARYVFPPGTVLVPGAFFSLNAAQLGFGFSELGSDVILGEVDGTNLVRFLDTVDVPAAAREESFGRYLRSDGQTDFTELRAVTRDGANALPRVGPVVFSEIMYHSATGRPEYVELVNISAVPVQLYDPARPAHTWVLSGAVDYPFPPGVTLAPCTPILVCSGDPAVFRAQYAIPPSVPVFGPWTGNLNNAGESIRLRQPGEPEPDGTVPYYRVDRVSYLPVAPWPEAADAGDISLERLPVQAYGNDPGGWTVSAPGGTPGRTGPGRAPSIIVSGMTAVDEGQTLLLNLQGVDPDAPWQSVTVAAHDLSAGGSFSPPTGRFTWTTGEADGPGDYPLRFTATDSGCPANVITQTVLVTVRELNQPPVLATIPNVQFPAQSPLSLLLFAADPDLPRQPLTFSQSGLPPGLDLAPATGMISGAGDPPGKYTVTVTVSDGQAAPLTSTTSFELTLTAPFLLAPDNFGEGGEALFSFPGLVGEAYEVQATQDLILQDWQPLETIPSALTNRLDIIDPDATNHPYRVYRIRWNR